MKRWMFIVLGLLVFCRGAIAGEETTVEELLKRNLDAIFSILQEKNLDQPSKNERITAIVEPMFDFDLMSKLALGRKYWPEMSRDKKEKFTVLFVKRLKSSYLDNMTLYTNESVIYEPARQIREKIYIPTYLISKDKKISMLYKFFKDMSDWKIYDLEIQGVSLIQSYRSQFDWILEKGTIDDLLLKLEAGDVK